MIFIIFTGTSINTSSKGLIRFLWKLKIKPQVVRKKMKSKLLKMDVIMTPPSHVIGFLAFLLSTDLQQ